MREVILALLGVYFIMAAEIISQQDRRDKLEDHKVTVEQATQAARIMAQAKQKGSAIDGGGAGCGRCSLQERLYCESAALFNDHCCCDTKLREPLTFAPHECWVHLPPAQPCMPVAENCAEYSRIMVCCCKHILFRQWHNKLESGAQRKAGGITWCGSLLMLLLLLLAS